MYLRVKLQEHRNGFAYKIHSIKYTVMLFFAQIGQHCSLALEYANRYWGTAFIKLSNEEHTIRGHMTKVQLTNCS